jgi:hypothetical protein
VNGAEAGNSAAAQGDKQIQSVFKVLFVEVNDIDAELPPFLPDPAASATIEEAGE